MLESNHKEEKRGLPTPLGELSAVAAGADGRKHPGLWGLESSYLRETAHLRRGEWPMHPSYDSLAPELLLLVAMSPRHRWHRDKQRSSSPS